MHNLFKSIGVSLAVFGAFFVLGTANAAEGRAGYNVNYVNANNRAGMVNQQRMPTMPTLPGNVNGNISPSIPNGNGNPPTPGCIPGTACTCSNGASGVYRTDCTCDCSTTPPTGCADGGVKDSEYSVENCMNDILACVNNGALPGGLNDLFNEDLRNAIFNGMSLCYIQIEKCVTDVRRDCRNIYASSSDVWWDFNSRKVQPEYYSFILRKTGLTPNQAENTCLLLDRNTYGSSFNAVSGNNNVTSEYNNRVGAYNSQAGNALVKTNPQGVKVNTDGKVDANRGHYARWDATTGECLIRVAAYNKDSHIKNSWLFGALGDDKPAEVWRAAGDTFSCNKNLFGFSLLNDTHTVAVVGIGGGTLAGAGVGAIAGHGKREFDCSRKSHREDLLKQLRSSGYISTINDYLPSNKFISNTAEDIELQCPEIVKLYDFYQRAMLVDISCGDGSASGSATRDKFNVFYKEDFKSDGAGGYLYDSVTVNGVTRATDPDWLATLDKVRANAVLNQTTQNGIPVVLAEKETIEFAGSSKDDCPNLPSLSVAFVEGTGIYECQGKQDKCVSPAQFKAQRDKLETVFAALPIITQGEKSNMVSSTLIGAGVGAGAGGLATAITSFVEKNNINCRVGDGLEKVSYGKSYSLGTLKDYYVKWNLRLPDTIMPTAQVKDCTSWKSACGTLKDLNQCVNAQINYRPEGANFTTLVNGACAISGSVCIENYPVAKSQGACD